jgi:hypothetical protein
VIIPPAVLYILILIYASGKADPPWVIQHTLKRHLAEIQDTQDRLKERMLEARKKERSLRRDSRRGLAHPNKKPRIDGSEQSRTVLQSSLDDEYLPDDEPSVSAVPSDPQDGISAEVRALMSQ